MKNTDYNIQKRTLQAIANDCAVAVSFEGDPAETSIWHYVFTALGQQREEAVQTVNLPLE